MKKNIFAGAVLFLLSGFFLSAEGSVNFSGDIGTVWGIAAPWTEENSAGRFTLGDTSFTGKLEAYYGDCQAYSDFTFSYDAERALNGSKGGGNLGNGFDISLGELWLDYSSSFWGIRVGMQKASWGKADGVDIVNVLCPSDASSFSAVASDDSKLAVDALRLSLNTDFITADFWWIPFFTPAKLPVDEGNPLRKFAVPESVDFNFPGMGNVTVPVSLKNFSTPEIAIWNGEYGIKMSGYFSAIDFSLYGFYGWDDIPLMDYSLETDENPPYTPTGINVGGEYKRMLMFGADAALPVGETVIRMEAAFFPMRHFQKSAVNIVTEKMSGGSAETSLRRNELSALVGLDWMPNILTFTAQYWCDVVFGDIESLERKKNYTHGATVSLSKSFINDTLEAGISAAINFNDFDSAIMPTVKYSLSDQIKLGAGAYIFLPGPSSDGKYGAYKNLSSFYLSAKYNF